MIIEKKPTNAEKYKFPWTYFESAREGLKAILELPQNKGKKILLPAYIGIDNKGESGVFDPIKAVGNEFEFYHLDRNLEIDFNDLENKINHNPGQILFIIHYFGFKDPQLVRIKRHAELNNMIIIEDFAHAYFTFVEGPVVDFDYAIFSFHKLFPVETGGAVVGLPSLATKDYNVLQDAIRIAQKRRENYSFLMVHLTNRIEILRPYLNLRYVYQSFPILLKDRKTRDIMYHKLNREGYGVTSLWHELISEIKREEFYAEHSISDRILNLPLHQEAKIEDLRKMVEVLLS